MAPHRGAPNLVLITLDTTRADALGTYGQIRKTSPNLDRLAAGGVLFEQVTTSNPETLPSHATIFTGKWPFTHGVRANSGYVLSEQNVTLAEILRSRGYRTGAEVAAMVLRRESLITQGFDHYRGADSPGVRLKEVKYTRGQQRTVTKPMRIGADITSGGIEFLRRNRNREFFLWLHYFDAHDPYSAPVPFSSMFPDSPYHAEVASADHQMGLVIEELDRLELRDETLIVVTADHGEGLYEHDEPSHSYFVYDTTMHVPLVLAGLRSLPAGLRVSSPVRTVDIVPTVLDLMGLPAPDETQGVSLRPLVSGRKTDLSLTGYGESTRFLTTFGLTPLRFIRQGRWKYIHKVNPELYDIVADPAERTNLMTRHPDVAERLLADLREMLRRAPPKPDDAESAVDAATAAQLAALGYVAHSPAPDLGAGESLELSGRDPVSTIRDTELISVAMGLIQREEFGEALKRLEQIEDRYPDSRFILDLAASTLQGLERYDEAAAARRRILELDPCDEQARDKLSFDLRERGRYDELLAVLGRGAAECPDSLPNLNNYAWALATLPGAELRDGAKAVRIIRSALAQRGERDPAYLDTLAAALAETGDFDEAVRIESEALQRLRAAGAPGELLAELEAHLESYRAHSPVRAPASGPNDS